MEGAKAGSLDGSEITSAHIFGSGGNLWKKHLEVVTKDRDVYRIPMDVIIEIVQQFNFRWERAISHKYMKDTVRR